MNIEILCIGKVKDSFNAKQIKNYCEIVNKTNHSLNVMEYPDLKIPDSLKDSAKESFIEKECEKIIQRITHKDYVVALCIEGKEIGTVKHKQMIQEAIDMQYERIVYVIGGSLGLPQRIKNRANLKLSFSKMTFPHQLMRMVLCEEIVEITK